MFATNFADIGARLYGKWMIERKRKRNQFTCSNKIFKRINEFKISKKKKIITKRLLIGWLGVIDVINVYTITFSEKNKSGTNTNDVNGTQRKLQIGKKTFSGTAAMKNVFNKIHLSSP